MILEHLLCAAGKIPANTPPPPPPRPCSARPSPLPRSPLISVQVPHVLGNNALTRDLHAPGRWLKLLKCWTTVVVVALSSLGRFWGACSTSPSPPALFFFFLGWTLARAHSTPGSIHSASASWDDCGRLFPDKLRVSSFPVQRYLQYISTDFMSLLSRRSATNICTPDSFCYRT